MKNLSALIKQLFRFGIVGVICTLLDYAILIFLKEVCSFDVLLAAGISFSISVIANYILSTHFVFEVNKEKNKKKTFVLFIIFSVIGLVLTELLMKLGTDVLGVHYTIVKIFSTLIVMGYNFITRKLFIEK